MLTTGHPTPTRLDTSTVRFNITSRGSRKIVDHHNKRRYRELLRETPHWNAELKVEQDEDGDWIIVGLIPSRWTHGRYGLEKNVLGNGCCWDSENEAQAHLDDHAEELRDELVDDLFTVGICTRCEAVVPVFGDYVPYAPAGSLLCGECLSEDEDEPAGPAILHA